MAVLCFGVENRSVCCSDHQLLVLCTQVSRINLACIPQFVCGHSACYTRATSSCLLQAETVFRDAAGCAENSPNCGPSIAPSDMQARLTEYTQAAGAGQGISQGRQAVVAPAGCTSHLPSASPAEAEIPTAQPGAMLPCHQRSTHGVKELAHSQLPASQARGEHDSPQPC